MNTNRNTEQLFHRMRDMPVDVPMENVEKFVIAQAALGITAVGVSKGIFTKAFFKFHLNSILIMTTTITASILGLIVWASDGEKLSARNNPKTNFEHSANGFVPDIETASDTPGRTTTKTVTNGEATTVTTIETETGTNLKIIKIGNGTAVYYNTPNDSTYVFAYESKNNPVFPPLPALSPMPYADALAPLPAIPPMPAMPPLTCDRDTLTSLLGKELLKDGLIKDTLHFTFKLNGTSMFVDGKKQPKEKWEKYKVIIENNSDYKVHHMFIFTTGKCGEDDAAGLMNFTSPPPMQPMQPMEPVYFDNSFKSSNDSLMHTLEKALLKDGLISDTLHYTFKINRSYMKVNGEKASKDDWRRYKEIIESNSLNRVNKNFSYAVRKDGEDICINVENYVN
ncbi:MAG: hypothetical protein M3R17_03955 [Bacteroidota bacterium]|nr:hypothetical protein [Bacteroidota bacterium]